MRDIRTIVHVIPASLWAVIGALALLVCALALRSRLMRRGARRLERQRRHLLGELGLLQRALLQEPPRGLPDADVSVAYRPAEGLAAGGDFYDVFRLDDNRTALLVGDVMGHGREALAITALMRYSLRAYLSAGLEPRLALRVASRTLAGDSSAELTTAVVAVHDHARGTLTYACAGHQPPLLRGAGEHSPVTLCSAPPLGGTFETGQRQTRVGLATGSTVCLFTDGLVESRVGDELFGRARLREVLGTLAPGEGAELLIERVASSASRTPDDMAACVLRIEAGVGAATGPDRVEELEVGPGELRPERLEPFLVECGVPPAELQGVLARARAGVSDHGSALLRIAITAGSGAVEVLPGEQGPLVLPATDATKAAVVLPT
ncbi:MAG: hypothetical protein NVSMB25_03900 [Thermoleophilaceae bacterium]